MTFDRPMYPYGMAAAFVLFLASGFAAAPTSWQSVGPGGGGALFQPSINPHDGDEIFVGCDMGELFRTEDFGQSWNPIHFMETQGGRSSKVQFTSDASIAYCVGASTIGGTEAWFPAVSTDGGATWSATAVDPTFGETYQLFADPDSTTRLIVTDYRRMYYSGDGGATFAERWDNPSDGIHIGGVFWDGASIYAGTNAGLLVSANGGASFSLDGTAGIGGGETIFSFCGAKESGTTRLWAMTATSGVWGGIAVEEFFYWNKNVYSLDVGGTWIQRQTGLPAGDGNAFAWIDCAQNDIDTAWVSGQAASEHPLLYRTTNGGASWSAAIATVGNVNVSTGWAGDGGDRGWWYGAGTTGFDVSPNDPDRAAFSDYGFVHVTDDGGTTWSQAYVDPATANAQGANTPTRQYYGGIGLENTSCWNLTWFDADTVWASFTDIRGVRTEDGGDTWGFDYSGHTENTSYDCVIHPNTGTAYMATSTVHDLHKTPYLLDSRIQNQDGRILYSTDEGETWSVLHNLGLPVFDLDIDPGNPNTMYAAVVDPSAGGIYRIDDIHTPGSSSFTHLTDPPRTQGRAYAVKVLDDGTLVCTFSGRRDAGSFTDSAGVFVSADGGASWADRTHANMHYYTKDIVVDPHDPAQNTWYAGVWGGWGGPAATNNDAGGLYRTTDRGANWTRIFQKHRVTGCTVNPNDADEAYVTTETEGLWYSDDFTAATPAFSLLMSYPFGHPEKVFFNPHDATEVWITSFGHGIRIGQTAGVPVELDVFDVD